MFDLVPCRVDRRSTPEHLGPFTAVREPRMLRASSKYLVAELANKIVSDPNAIEDELFSRLKKYFSDEQIVELVFAASIFNFGNKFNITMRLDTAKDSPYGSIFEKGIRYPYELEQ
jgi:alkylhydroperoxidase family enzyme